MKYQSQKVALYYFVAAMALFGIQVLGGLLAGWVYVSPNFLAEILPFNIIRMIHTNALIVWLLLGFFGAAYSSFQRRPSGSFGRQSWPISSCSFF